MTAALNLMGRKIGRLIVIGRSPRREKRGTGTFWICRCECGRETHVRTSWLASGRTKSCGCYRRAFRILPDGEAALRYRFRQYRDNARARRIGFDLTVEEFRFAGSRDCSYCGRKPQQVFAREGKRPCGTELFWNGIDRRDNLKGYTFSNSVSCCSICNYMKRALGHTEFLSHVRRIAFYASVF